MSKAMSGLESCDRCGGTAREQLKLGERAANLCRDCHGEAATILNAWMMRREVLIESTVAIPAGEPIVEENNITGIFF